MEHFPYLGYSELAVFVVGTWLVVNGTFWSLNTILFFIYRWNLLPQCRVPGAQYPPPEMVWE